MFEVRNETEIWYKAKEMPDWIHYGSAVVAEPIEKEKFAVKRFDLEKGEYLLFADCKTYFYNGVEYSVTDGCFTVPKNSWFVRNRCGRPYHPNKTLF